MSQIPATKSATVRAKLGYPVIDSDGHSIEFEPGVLEHLERVGGAEMARSFTTWGKEIMFRWYKASPDERSDKRVTRGTWWGVLTKNTLDRATASLPKLFYDRLGDLGIDVSVLYPTLGLPAPHIAPEDLRKAVCRAFNSFYAETYSEFSDRLIPAGVIPMHTPQEAIDELEYAVKVLGLKVFMFAGFVRRPVPAVAREHPGAANDAFWIDTYGLDSAHDYDPVWAKCVELKVNPSFHSSGMGWGSRASISNYMHNHLGMFATAGESLCRSLFLGGVTRRFPQLKFAFLEGGVGWACSLYSDIIGHWKKRNINMLENYNPANLDGGLMLELYRKYGGRMVEGKLSDLDSILGLLNVTEEDPKMLDEFAACGIERQQDIYELFVPRFYFGCEADDPINSWAFNTRANPMKARMNVLFGSDIAHWDVPDITETVEEAYELLEDGLITEEDLQDFLLDNPVSFYGNLNQDFFKGTVVEAEAAKRLASESIVS